MMSNGLSNRRVVLKRPKVCKSKDKECGNCSLVASAIPVDGDPSFPFQLEVDLQCDPVPTVTLYQMKLGGGATLDDPTQTITVNQTAFVPCHAPEPPGDYILAVIVFNTVGCFHIFELDVIVNVP